MTKNHSKNLWKETEDDHARFLPPRERFLHSLTYSSCRQTANLHSKTAEPPKNHQKLARDALILAKNVSHLHSGIHCIRMRRVCTVYTLHTHNIYKGLPHEVKFRSLKTFKCAWEVSSKHIQSTHALKKTGLAKTKKLSQTYMHNLSDFQGHLWLPTIHFWDVFVGSTIRKQWEERRRVMWHAQKDASIYYIHIRGFVVCQTAKQRGAKEASTLDKFKS